MNTENKSTEENITEKKGFFKNFLENVAENVKEGAAFVSEKAAIVGSKVAETSAKAYESGSELVSETSEKIHDFTEKQTLHKEESKLEKRQIALKHHFGILTFDHYLENSTFDEPFLNSDILKEIVTEFKANETRLLAIIKEIEAIENH